MTDVTVRAPLPATVAAVHVGVGDRVAEGATLVVLESMKMEHPVLAPSSGTIGAIRVGAGDQVHTDDLLVVLVPGVIAEPAVPPRPDGSSNPALDEVRDRHDRLEDHRRPGAVERRRARGRRTARANLEDLVDAGSFTEYGALATAAQSARRDPEDLIENTSTDGVITGLATINADQFEERAAACAVILYDATILAGTQGWRGHQKQDRILRIALANRLPAVVFAEGGGGRPGDVDLPIIAGLEVPTFRLMAQLSGRAPTVAVVAGYCFAGNAMLAATADVIIATEDSNLGVGGPAMIEGGGLGRFSPTEIGPIDEQVSSGVVDIRVPDEAAATVTARRYLAYFQGDLPEWDAPDQTALRDAVPTHRAAPYDVRTIIEVLTDRDSVLELRPYWGKGMITALARIEGRTIGVLANSVHHLGGAIDATAADKAARFLSLCDAYDVPVVVLCDTPGFMVGPDVEREAMVRRAGRLLVTGANLGVPVGTVVLRKGYGLGAQAMAAGAFKTGDFTISWPTGEFGGMNLEGAVTLGYRKELEAVTDPAERAELYESLLARMYEQGRALTMASHLEIDAVIDPAETRRWVVSMLRTARPPRWRAGDHRHRVDPI